MRGQCLYSSRSSGWNERRQQGKMTHTWDSPNRGRIDPGARLRQRRIIDFGGSGKRFFGAHAIPPLSLHLTASPPLLFSPWVVGAACHTCERTRVRWAQVPDNLSSREFPSCEFDRRYSAEVKVKFASRQSAISDDLPAITISHGISRFTNGAEQFRSLGFSVFPPTFSRKFRRVADTIYQPLHG